MATTEAPAAQRPTHVRWYVFSLAFATSALLYLHRYVFAFIKPTLAKDWGLSSTQLGEIDTAFSLSYSLIQLPLAIGADVWGVRLLLSGLMLTWCAGLGMMAWAPSIKWMWYAQALLGTGQSAVYACLSRIARTWYPPAVRTTMQGMVGVFAGRLGALGASILFTTLLLGVLKLDWRTAIWILVATGVMNLLLFWTVFRNNPRQHPGVNAAEVRLIEGGDTPADRPVTQSAPRAGVMRTLRSTTPRSFANLLCLSLQTALSTFADNIYSNWIPLFLAQVHHLEFKQMGIYAALPLLGGAIGGMMGGMLNDFLIARTGNRRWSRVGVAFVGKGLAAVLIFTALLFYNRPYAFCVMLFFVKLFGDWSLTTTLGVVTDIGGRTTASVYAFCNSVAGISLVTAPLVYGYLADNVGWRIVFITAGIVYVLCALSWLFIDCTIPVVPETSSNEHPTSNV